MRLTVRLEQDESGLVCRFPSNAWYPWPRWSSGIAMFVTRVMHRCRINRQDCPKDGWNQYKDRLVTRKRVEPLDDSEAQLLPVQGGALGACGLFSCMLWRDLPLSSVG